MLIHLILFYIACSFAQEDYQEWYSITSLLSPRDIIISEDENIYASTAGGVLEFNTITKEFNNIKLEEGLIYLDISIIEKDKQGRLWLGGAYPNGYIQVYDPLKGLVGKITHLNISEILHIKIEEDLAFASYKGHTSNEIGILVFELDNDGLPIYKDYYINFSTESISEIRDLDYNLDTIYVTTDKGVYAGNYSDNLKNDANWNKISNIVADQFIAYDSNHIVLADSIYYYIDGNWKVYDFSIKGKILEAKFINEVLCALTNENYYEIVEGKIRYNFEVPIISHSKTDFTSFIKNNDYVYICLYKAGLISLNINTSIYSNYLPNTPFYNDYNSLVVMENGNIAATSRKGTLIFDGDTYKNYIPWQFTKYTPDWRNDIYDNRLRWTYLKYLAGEHIPLSIIENKDGNLIIPNSGIMPDEKLWLDTGAIIELDYKTSNFISFGRENNIIDGFWGIYNPNIFNQYMVVNELVKDKNENVWVVNPFCEKYGNLLSIQSALDKTWAHIKVPDNTSYIPQTLDFDSANRAWIGFAYNALDDRIYSNGGVKVFNVIDSSWIYLDNPEALPGNDSTSTIWSLIFDKRNILWIMGSKGVRFYESYFFDRQSSKVILKPFSAPSETNPNDLINIDYLSNLSYTKGNRIRVDSQNNKWIITHHGIWVILENLNFWPSEQGINSQNSKLLSNTVYDIAFDDKLGLAYIATDKGISIFHIPFSENPSKDEELFISPNPFIVPDNEHVIIKNFYSGSKIKIMTISGILIKEYYASANESQFVWDGKDMNGNIVGTAVYLVGAYHSKNKNKIAKIAIIRN